MTRGRAVLVPALVVVFAVTSGGWLLQRGVGMRANIYLHARVFEEVVERIEGHFVGEVDVDDLYEAAIAGVVDHLGDPNSQFLPAARWEDERIRTQGEYGGVGLEVADRDGYITVVAPIPGTPGARAGVRPGDRIVEVDGRSVEGWLTDQAVDLLRGRPGTTVRMGIRRPGADAIIHFDVTRAQIHVPSVPFATMLDDGVGYVPLLIFNRTTTKEVRAAIDSLAAEGMTSLVLDLRRNRGGLLTEGVGLTDLFLDPGMDIVEIRSRASAPEKYAAMVDQSYPDLPVVVLVGYGSASAAEIVAGALQDHDRALLIGSTTYGKGSVQSLFPLSGGNVLKLTTARWFTPSGRSIEMDAADQAARGDRGVLTVQGDVAELPELADKPEFRSAGGRLVRGGGGIVPDLWVLQDTLLVGEREAVREILASGGAFVTALQSWVVGYLQDHPDLAPDFRLTDADLAGFRTALEERGAGISIETLQRARRSVLLLMESEVALQAWGDGGRFERIAGTDAALRRAVELLTAAEDQRALFRLAGSPLGEAEVQPVGQGPAAGDGFPR
ncbi:MAG: S41 family peptidase [Gemmatimonadota bacterium]|nr:S41 family peptidase [Gemmatimonadota bacterium]